MPGWDTFAVIIGGAAGAVLLAGGDDGLDVVIPAVIAAITGGIASAWLFPIRITA